MDYPEKCNVIQARLMNKRMTPPRNSTSPAESVTTISNMLPRDFEVVDGFVISETEFQRIKGLAEEGNLTESDLRKIQNDENRAKEKRKNAILAGRLSEAASASSRAQEIVKISFDYSAIGVRSMRGRIKGGRATGKTRKEKAGEMEADVHGLATQLLQSHGRREISGMIMQRLKMSRPTVLKHLKNHPTGYWKK